MSRKGDCWDNAVAESFFATLKGELVDRALRDASRGRASALFDYIEVFYNRRRRTRRSAMRHLSSLKTCSFESNKLHKIGVHQTGGKFH